MMETEHEMPAHDAEMHVEDTTDMDTEAEVPEDAMQEDAGAAPVEVDLFCDDPDDEDISGLDTSMAGVEVSRPSAEAYAVGKRAPADPGYRALTKTDEERGIMMPDGKIHIPITRKWVEEETERRNKAASRVMTATFPSEVGSLPEASTPERQAVANRMADILRGEMGIQDPRDAYKDEETDKWVQPTRLPCMDADKPEEFARDAQLLLEQRGIRMYVGADDGTVTLGRNDTFGFEWPSPGTPPKDALQACMLACMPDLNLPADHRRLPMHHEMFMNKVVAMLDNNNGRLSSMGLPNRLMWRPAFMRMLTTNTFSKVATMYEIVNEETTALIELRTGFGGLSKTEYEDLCDGPPGRDGKRPGRAAMEAVVLPRFITPRRGDLELPPIKPNQVRVPPPPYFGGEMNDHEFMKAVRSWHKARADDSTAEEDINWKTYFLLRAFLREWYHPTRKPFSKPAWRKQKKGKGGEVHSERSWFWFCTLERFQSLAPTILRTPTRCSKWSDVQMPAIFDTHFLECVAAWMSHAVQVVTFNRQKDTWIDALVAAQNVLQHYHNWKQMPEGPVPEGLEAEVAARLGSSLAGRHIEKAEKLNAARQKGEPETPLALPKDEATEIADMIHSGFAVGNLRVSNVRYGLAQATFTDLAAALKPTDDRYRARDFAKRACRMALLNLWDQYDRVVEGLLMGNEVALQIVLAQRIICAPDCANPWQMLRTTFEMPPVHEASDDSLLRHRCYDVAMRQYTVEQKSFFEPGQPTFEMWDSWRDVLETVYDDVSDATLTNMREAGLPSPIALVQLAMIGNPLFDATSERGRAYWNLISGGMGDVLQLLITSAKRSEEEQAQREAVKQEIRDARPEIAALAEAAAKQQKKETN